MGLYQKMHAVMCDSEAIEKNMVVGKIGSGNEYKAVSEAAVLNEIKPLLKKHGLVLFPVGAEISESFLEVEGKYGKTQRFLSTLKSKYKIVDIDSGEFDILETVGYGVDSQDKASGKAMTYAYKALIQKTFCLFSGEDSDAEHSDDITTKNTVPSKDTTKSKTTSTKQPDKPTPVKLITPNEAADLLSLCGKKGVPITKIMETYGVTELANLTFENFAKAVGRLEKTPDKVETNA